MGLSFHILILLKKSPKVNFFLVTKFFNLMKI